MQSASQPNLSSNSNSNGKQLIDNLVGNWVPNQSGTYSPFGGSPNVTPVPQFGDTKEVEELPRNPSNIHLKKPPIVAEVKPMRPTYSDVLAKSSANPIAPISSISSKPKLDNTAK